MRISHRTEKNTNGLSAVLSLVVGGCVQAQTCTPVVEFSHEENSLGFGNQSVVDAEIAVGPGRIMVCSNSWILLHDKNGDPISGQEAELT